MLRRPFRTRTVILGISVGAVALALIATVVLLRQVLIAEDVIRVNNALEQEAQELTEFARSQTPNPDENPADFVRRVLLTYVETNVPGSNEALYALQDGSVFASSAPLTPELEAFARTFSGLENPTFRDGLLSEGPIRALGQPVLFAGGPQGHLVVVSSTSDDRARINRTVLDAGVIATIMVLAAFAISWFVAGRALRPIELLADTAHDITEHDLAKRLPVQGTAEISQLINSFNAMVDRLDSAVRKQQQFLSDASHELRTPLTVMQGHIELAETDPSHAERSKRIVAGELERMSRIVDDLLVLARSEEIDFLQLSPIDIDDFLRGILDLVQDIGPQRWVLDEVPLGIVEADAARLTQAMLNLATNADRHTPDDQEIGIGGAVDEQTLRLWVRDTGEGIDPSEHDRIFERMGRATETRSPRGSAGLGLTIVKAIAEAHGGSVTVESTRGQGATFTIGLPLQREDAWPES